jgi:uncharacterized protein (TIGR00304 family)
LTDAGPLYTVGFTLLFAGIIVLAIAIILAFLSSSTSTAKGGGVILVGPVPIIFGTDKKSLRTVLVLSITLTIILTVATIIFHFTSK